MRWNIWQDPWYSFNLTNYSAVPTVHPPFLVRKLLFMLFKDFQTPLRRPTNKVSTGRLSAVDDQVGTWMRSGVCLGNVSCGNKEIYGLMRQEGASKPRSALAYTVDFILPVRKVKLKQESNRWTEASHLGYSVLVFFFPFFFSCFIY